jgi:hypothetical protein
MRRLVCLAVLCLPALARADSVYRDPNDPGKVTNIGRGVWEMDVGALGVLAVDNEGDTSVTRLSTDFSAQLHYFVKNNLSIGVEALFDFDDNGDNQSSTAFGGAIDATVHLRLGLGAFFRPGIAIGALFGHRNLPLMDGTIDQASQVGVITRLALPIAYFASPRLLLQAGPQINVTAGSFTPTGGDAQSFTRIAGGFSVGLGYVF